MWGNITPYSWLLKMHSHLHANQNVNNGDKSERVDFELLVITLYHLGKFYTVLFVKLNIKRYS